MSISRVPPSRSYWTPKTGICNGRDELRAVLEQVAARKPPLRTYYRTGYVTDGERTMIFEYPRDAPEGEQMDFVEVMELSDGLIQRHCVYWGWRGIQRRLPSDLSAAHPQL